MMIFYILILYGSKIISQQTSVLQMGNTIKQDYSYAYDE